jgi:diguanylate cyclase (GGDEF)-like protein
MFNSTFARRACIAAAWWLSSALAIASAMDSPALATCLPSADPQIRRLQTLVGEDAARALKEAQSQLEALERPPHPDARRMASLYAVQAQAYTVLELGDDAKRAALKGLQLAPLAGDPVHLQLLSTYAENIYDAAGVLAALKSIQAARAAQVKGSPADICLLITRGLLEYREDRADLAIGSLTQAYRASAAPEFAEPHVIAADTLSIAMRSSGDYAQALALNQEAIDWNTAHRATTNLSLNRFMRGRILSLMGRYAAAIDEFAAARKLSVQLNGTQGVAFADVQICEARIEVGELDRAEPECQSALAAFSASGTVESVKEAQALLARIDLARGHAQKALKALNRVLDHGGADLLPSRVADLYQWRARANAALHDYRDAYADLTEYLGRSAAANDRGRARAAAALRARFETDREIERNAELKRELEVSQERSQRQARELRWNAIVAVSGVLVIALLVYFLAANLRYRHQLLRLASQDSLTGLPNRRRTAEFATQALEAAARTETPLTLAIIDLDHFKLINDRCGHATGDHVLKEFARMGRELLRETDVLGRWGGEEFLLVMPDSSLEMALATLDRLRTMMFGIQLPASGAGLRVSLSAGLATSFKHGGSLDELIMRADTALYVAKNEGRDMVRVADDDHPTTAVRRALRQ